MIFNILITLMLITKAKQSISQQKLVYQIDMSEYCKRRVLPSIFLAKNSVETSAYVMHFTQKEMPYSCPISVRAESGYNILMVIKISPLQGMKKRCEKNTPELLVYEMGETFGGYWGPFGRNIFQQKSVEPKLYTLKTTQSISTEKPVVTTTKQLKQTQTTKQDQNIIEDSEDEDFISVDVPLVNVSGKFVFVDKGNDSSSNEDEDAMFDLEYDVTPEPGVKYTTTVIPIVQFSIKSHPGWRKEGDDSEPRFDLDIVEKYTPDHRLTLPRYESTRRLKFRKFSPRTTTRRRHQYFLKNSTKGKLQTLRFTSHKYTGYNFPTMMKASKSLQNVSRFHSWKTIEELIDKVNLTASLRKKEDNKLSDKKNNILHKIADMKHKFSIYLEPNLSLYDSPKSSDSTTVKRNTLSTSSFNKTQTKYAAKSKATNQVTSKITELINITSTSVGQSPLDKLDSVPSIYENYYIKRLTTSSTVEVISNKVFKGTDNKINSTQMDEKSLVDHESWENVVQAAPDMAVLLNITKDEIKKHNVVTNNGTTNKSLGSKNKRRKKREIHAIEINDSRPHNMTTKIPTVSTSISSFGVADIQEFSQLIEIQDDELYGHVALRFLRQYVGPVIYNICEFNSSAKHQHIHLFNASRIVIAINNFTNLASLSLILTSARTLVPGEVECPDTNIECQVAGARVCIDAMSACDGVPNCGSYDIYDEDRLMCGESEGLQHNVYIAAFTFLAVLLTLLYSVHYWLRRCVPRVADAFFIYTNGTENILSLAPIMRSPHDYSDEAQLFFHPSMLEADIDTMPEKKEPNCCQRFMRKLCCGLILRKSTIANSSNKTDGDEMIINFDPKVKYSFTQLQIQNVIRKNKLSTQSGDSVELVNIMDAQVSPPTIPLLKSVHSILTLEEPLPEDYKDELGMLKFLKKNRRFSLGSVSNEVLLGTEEGFSISSNKNSEEMELKNVEYNQQKMAEPGPSGVKPKNKKEQSSEPGPSGIKTTNLGARKLVSKRLRFDDNTTMIPASIVEVDEEEEEIDEHSRPQRHGTFFDTVMGKQKFFGGFEDDNESSLQREHKRFWGGSSKVKKPSRSKNTH